MTRLCCFAVALAAGFVVLDADPAAVVGQPKGKGKGGTAPRPTPAINRPQPAARPAARPAPRPAPRPAARPAPRPAPTVNRRPGVGPGPARAAAPTVVNRPTTNRSTVNRPTVNQSTVNRPTTNRTTVNRPTVNRTTVNRPDIDRTTINQPRVRVGDRVTNRTNINNNVNRTNINRTNINRTNINQSTVNRTVNRTTVNRNVNRGTVVNRVGGYSRGGYGGRPWWGGTATYWNRPWYGNRPAWYWSRPWYGYHAGWHSGYWNFWRTPPALWFGTGLAAGWLVNPGETFVYSNPYYVPAASFVQIDYTQPIPAPPVELESAAFPADPDLDNDGVPDVRPTADLPAPAADPAAAAANQRLEEARLAFRDGRYARAQELAEAAIRDLPSDATLHEFLALTLFAQARYQDAAAALYAVLSAGPGWDWQTMRGLYPDTETYTRQLRGLELFVGANPRAGHGHFLLAYHYLVVGDRTSAVGQLREVTQVQPEDKLAASLLRSLTEAAADPPPGPGR